MLILLVAGDASSFSQFQSEVPNGSRGSCLTCHEGRNGGRPWNNFGDLLFTTNGGTADSPSSIPGQGGFDDAFVWWNATICSADSDGDGQTNGQELGDPNCLWTGGLAERTSEISLPGDGNSTTIDPDGVDPVVGEGEGEGEDILNVTSVTPNRGPAGTAVVILGSGFDARTTARVGSDALSDIIIDGDSSIRGNTSIAMTPGTYDVIVQRGAELFTFPSGFTLEDADDDELVDDQDAIEAAGSGCSTTTAGDEAVFGLAAAAIVGQRRRRRVRITRVRSHVPCGRA